MTLTQIQKMRRQSGVTLVELLVVILIVAILAVGLLPVFRRLIVEAQYSNEPMSVIGSLRTQISLYMYEHNKVPVDDADVGQVITFARDSNNESYECKSYTLSNTYTDPTGASDAVTEHYLTKLDLGIDQFQGNRLTPNQVQFVCTVNGAGYCYAIGAFGTGNEGELPLATGYAVMEVNFPQVVADSSADSKLGYHVLATWRNYDGNGTDPDVTTPICFSDEVAQSCCAVLKAADVTDPTTIADVETNLDALNATGKCGKWTYPKAAN